MTALIQRRIIAAVRFVHAGTGTRLREGLVVEPVTDARWVPNASGDWVLAWADGFDDYVQSFETPPSTPSDRSVTVDAVVRSVRPHFESRQFSVQVPRPIADGPGSARTPVVVAMPPGPAHPLRRTWAAIRVSVRFAPAPGETVGAPIEGALVRLADTVAAEERCRSLTDARGEGLVIAPAVPLVSAGGSSSGPVIATAVDHEVTVVVDRTATDLETGARSSVANPDDLWDQRASLATVTTSLSLAPGDERHRPIEIPRS